MSKIAKGHVLTLSKFNGICPKVNRVIYISSPISVPNTKALAQTLFEISCYQDFNLIFEKGITLELRICQRRKKKIWDSYFSITNLYMKFQDPSNAWFKSYMRPKKA